MNLLLDTHALIWFLEGDSRLSALARQSIEDPANQNFVSTAALWEIAIKNSLGKLDLKRPFAQLPSLLAANGIDVLPVSFVHLELVNLLVFHHRDPFDRLMIAQAQSEGMMLVSLDPNFPSYGIGLIW